MNAINVIAPYKYNGSWVFDDPGVGLRREPFVSGADTMIEYPRCREWFHVDLLHDAIPGPSASA
jgi:hypothetical protein